MQRRGLRSQKLIVTSGVHQMMEMLIEAVIAVGVPCAACGLARAVGRLKLRAFGVGHAAGRVPPAHRLKLRHDFEHLDEALRAELGNGGAASMANVNHSSRTKLQQRLSHGRARNTELPCEFRLVQRCAGWQFAGGNGVFNALAELVSE